MELEYEGRIYKNIDGKWYLNYVEVSTFLQKELNALVAKKFDLEKMSFEELVKYADGYKKTDSYNLALEYYQKAINKYENLSNVKSLLSRITSCYRLINNPQGAIEIYNYYNNKYGDKIINEPLLISIAAAYIDVNNYKEAKKYADRTFAIIKSNNGQESEELMLVYERLKTIKR